MKNQPLSFAIGDIVLYEGKENVIFAIQDSFPITYGINGSCWYDYEDLTFVKRATKTSLKQAKKWQTEE